MHSMIGLNPQCAGEIIEDTSIEKEGELVVCMKYECAGVAQNIVQFSSGNEWVVDQLPCTVVCIRRKMCAL